MSQRTTEPAPRRRHLFVDRELQGVLVRRTVLHFVLFVCIFAGGLVAPILVGLDHASAQQEAESATVLLYMHGRFWWLAAACMVIVGGDALLLSHRIAGPLVRFKRHLAMIGGGVVPPQLHRRPRDFLEQEVSLLNAAARRLGELAAAQTASRDALAATLRRCQTDMQRGNTPAALAALTEAQTQAQAIETLRLDARPAASPAAGPAVAERALAAT